MAEASYYPVWTGALNLGDTPGVFNYAQFCGLLVQLPLRITFNSGGVAKLRLRTTDVEIFGGAKHPVYWDWVPGQSFPTPVGYIDDTTGTPSVREFHEIEIPSDQAKVGIHTLTIHVNSDVALAMKDDFVLEQIDAEGSIGVRIGAS